VKQKCAHQQGTSDISHVIVCYAQLWC